MRSTRKSKESIEDGDGEGWRGALLEIKGKEQLDIKKVLVPSPSETWFRGMSVGGSFRRV